MGIVEEAQRLGNTPSRLYDGDITKEDGELAVAYWKGSVSRVGISRLKEKAGIKVDKNVFQTYMIEATRQAIADGLIRLL